MVNKSLSVVNFRSPNNNMYEARHKSAMQLNCKRNL